MLMLQLAEKLERTGGRMHMDLTAGDVYVPDTVLELVPAQTLTLRCSSLHQSPTGPPTFMCCLGTV